MTKTKVIRLLNELAERYGKDYVVSKLIDRCKQKIGWYQGKRLPDDECIFKTVTLGDLIAGTETENWNPNNLRDLIKKLQNGNYTVETIGVRPEESEKELQKYIEEHKEECDKREKEAANMLKRYWPYAKPYFEMQRQMKRAGIKL